MKKKSVIVCALIAIFLVATLAVTLATAQEAEEDKVIKAYDWLVSKVRTATLWQELNIREHVFALLALRCNSSYVEPGNVSLYGKAYIGPPHIGTCWGEKDVLSDTDCRIAESALAKLAADKLELFDTERVNDWLLNQSLFYEKPDWYLELDVARGVSAECIIGYDGINTTVAIDENKMLNITNVPAIKCFDDAEVWWLSIDKDCYEKSFKIKCTVADGSEYRVTLKYKELSPAGVVWHVSTKSDLIPSGDVWEFSIQSYCLANPGSTLCDYEGTAWATYALKESGQPEYARFIPYLIIAKEDNERLLPAALLYLTGLEGYGDELQEFQQPKGFWIAENTKHGQFYDTALAGLTGLGDLGSEPGGARYYLTTNLNFKETPDRRYRYWKCTETGCKDLRDTAFLLWVFWPGLCPGIIPPRLDCEEQGYSCRYDCLPDEVEDVILTPTCAAGLVCCRPGIVETCEEAGGTCTEEWECPEGQFEKDIECAIWEICCKRYSDAKCEEFGQVCEEDQRCSVDTVESTDELACCPGECIESPEGKTCEEIYGTTCLEGQVCMDEYTWEQIPFEATLDELCCIGRCVEDRTCIEVGEVCGKYEECSVSTVGTTDEQECCPGVCEPTRSCLQLGGEICEPPDECSIRTVEATDTFYCCPPPGECRKRARWWLWLLIIVIVAAGILLYFFYFRKPKKKKPPFVAPPGMPPRRPLIPAARPPARPMPGMPPARPAPPARPGPVRPIPRPARGKTETELEKTLKKLKGMTKK